MIDMKPITVTLSDGTLIRAYQYPTGGIGMLRPEKHRCHFCGQVPDVTPAMQTEVLEQLLTNEEWMSTYRTRNSQAV